NERKSKHPENVCLTHAVSGSSLKSFFLCNRFVSRRMGISPPPRSASSPANSVQSPPADNLANYVSSRQSHGPSPDRACAIGNSCFHAQIQPSPSAICPAPPPATPVHPDTPSVSSAWQSPACLPCRQTEKPPPAHWLAEAAADSSSPSAAQRRARLSGSSAGTVCSMRVPSSCRSQSSPVGARLRFPAHLSTLLPDPSVARTGVCRAED